MDTNAICASNRLQRKKVLEERRSRSALRNVNHNPNNSTLESEIIPIAVRNRKRKCRYFDNSSGTRNSEIDSNNNEATDTNVSEESISAVTSALMSIDNEGIVIYLYSVLHVSFYLRFYPLSYSFKYFTIRINNIFCSSFPEN